MDVGGRQGWGPVLGPITSQLCDLGQVNLSTKRGYSSMNLTGLGILKETSARTSLVEELTRCMLGTIFI